MTEAVSEERMAQMQEVARGLIERRRKKLAEGICPSCDQRLDADPGLVRVRHVAPDGKGLLPPAMVPCLNHNSEQRPVPLETP